MNELGFVFHSENCVQCHACQAACKIWRQTPRGADFRRIHSLWRGDYPDVALSTLSVSCMHCVDPACVAACPTGAVSKREEDGLVFVDSALCTGCRSCYEACPVGAPQFTGDCVNVMADSAVPGGDAANGAVGDGAATGGTAVVGTATAVTMQKCDFCANGPLSGVNAACVLACPTHALEQAWLSTAEKAAAELVVKNSICAVIPGQARDDESVKIRGPLR